MQIGGISIDAIRAGANQFVFAAIATEHADDEHAGATRGKQIPDCVADDVAIGRRQREPLRGTEEQCRIGLCSRNLAAFDHDHVIGHVQRDQRCIDLRSSTGSGDSMGNAVAAQAGRQIDGAWQ